MTYSEYIWHFRLYAWFIHIINFGICIFMSLRNSPERMYLFSTCLPPILQDLSLADFINDPSFLFYASDKYPHHFSPTPEQ